MKYDGVIFDFDGVLLDSGSDGFEWARKVRKRKARDMGYSVDGDNLEFIFFADSREHLLEMIEERGMTVEDYREIERAVAMKKVEMVQEGTIELFSSAVKVLESLETPVSLVSNAYGEAVDSIVAHLGLDSHLDYWTAPRVEKLREYPEVMKPNTVMLEEAVERMDVDNPVMVGDSDFDIQAANNYGIDSVLINRYGFADAEPTHSISSLQELHSVLNS